ncbi:hypothetical protein SM021_004233 [Cronobacter muytjensii]|nr:hypothetical protein [Cronobacter muytjensii]
MVGQAARTGELTLNYVLQTPLHCGVVPVKLISPSEITLRNVRVVVKWMYDFLNILGGISFITVSVVGYLGKLYFERYKRKQDEKIKNLQSRLDLTNAEFKSQFEKINHVSKSQFDKEFAIYHEIWACIFGVANSVSKLRPVLDRYAPDESREVRRERRLKTFYDNYNPLVVAMESNRPFYFEDVYKLVCEYRDLCRKEALEYQHEDDYPHPKKYWESHQENMRLIKDCMEKCSEAIRDRIYSLTIVK